MFYLIDQNNSGGYIITDENVASVVIIEAESEQKAKSKFVELGMYDYDYCECCGERFSLYFTQTLNTEQEAIKEGWDYVCDSDEVQMIIHRIDGSKHKVMLSEKPKRK
ncbi:MAG: hypothetical protein EBW87_05625 [Burkholderiaceae bacterium]|nr:hypothetical protein [Burkholderiaceae bacterium]